MRTVRVLSPDWDVFRELLRADQVEWTEGWGILSKVFTFETHQVIYDRVMKKFEEHKALVRAW